MSDTRQDYVVHAVMNLQATLALAGVPPEALQLSLPEPSWRKLAAMMNGGELADPPGEALRIAGTLVLVRQ